MAKKDEVQTEDEVLKAKVALYNKLLCVDATKMSSYEASTLYSLYHDKQLQQFLDWELNAKRNSK